MGDSARGNTRLPSAVASAQARRAHNNISLKLEEFVTADHLAKLKQYFRSVPLSETEAGKITTFKELWNALSDRRTIKPGEYSELKKALTSAGAENCAVLLMKLERDAFDGPGEDTLEEQLNTMRIERQRLHRELEEARAALSTSECERGQLKRELEKTQLWCHEAIKSKSEVLQCEQEKSEELRRALQSKRDEVQREQMENGRLRRSVEYEKGKREEVEKELRHLRSQQGQHVEGHRK